MHGRGRGAGGGTDGHVRLVPAHAGEAVTGTAFRPGCPGRIGRWAAAPVAVPRLSADAGDVVAAGSVPAGGFAGGAAFRRAGSSRPLSSCRLSSRRRGGGWCGRSTHQDRASVKVRRPRARRFTAATPVHLGFHMRFAVREDPDVKFSRPPCRTPAAPAVGALRKFLPRAPRCELGHDLLLRPRGTKVFSGLLTSFGHVSTLALQAAPPITRWCTSRRDRAPTPWWCAPAGAASIPRELPRSPPFPCPCMEAQAWA